ncbi:MAG: penicillin-binding transpeptidase domain-containing protein [Candidatus Zixiibacteriota bacterium]
MRQGRRERRSAGLRQGRNAAGQKTRLGMALVCMAIVWCVIVGRLWTIQVVSGSDYARIAEKQATGKIPLPAERGVIYDRTGREVAVNVLRHSLCAYPQDAGEVQAAGTYLDRLLGLRRGESITRYRIQPKRFRWIKRGVSDQLAQRVKADGPPALFIRDERSREYPYGLIGKQILGYTDVDSKGISGLEARYDDHLRGRAGMADIRRDGLRQTYQVKERPLRNSQPGGSLILSIDWVFQEIVEEELKTAVEKHNAVIGDAVFVDCSTGEILAVARCDPDDERGERPSKLPPITDTFEPGSVYKIISAAAILDENVAVPARAVDCENGSWRCGRRILHDDKEHDRLSFHQVIALSSNIGVAKLAIELGGDRLAAASRRFGIGQRTRVDFPGEQRGTLHSDERWSDYNVAALSIGHSVSVTPLQMTMAMAAVANGGALYRPRFVRGVVGPGGSWRDKTEPEQIARALSANSAKALRSMLLSVVDSGTATQARSEVIRIAGKTGTAEIPRKDGRGYHKNKFIASFAGFFPADSPVIAGIITLHRPEPIHYGGYTSGPAFRRIAERYSQANPGRFGFLNRRLDLTGAPDASFTKAPHLIGLTGWAARKAAKKAGLSVKGIVNDGDVVWQFPAAGERISPGSAIAALTGPGTKVTGGAAREFVAPDVVGLTSRQAALLLAQLRIPFDLDGSGRIIRQLPPAGSIIKQGQAALLSCQTPETLL